MRMRSSPSSATSVTSKEITLSPSALFCTVTVEIRRSLSASRGVGAGIFNALKDRWAEGFAADGEAAQRYLGLHDQAVPWARQNRLEIARTAAQALRSDLTLICDAPHNHVERHGDGWLHRKGAAKPDGGLAPLAGSRETASYLLATPDMPPEALGSLSHGAGRRYDRSSMHGRIPRNASTFTAMARNPFGGHVVCEDRDLLIEEAGHAYKDAGQVVDDLTHFGVAYAVARMVPLLTYKTTRGGSDD